MDISPALTIKHDSYVLNTTTLTYLFPRDNLIKILILLVNSNTIASNILLMGHYIIIILIGHFVLNNNLLNKIILQYIVYTIHGYWVCNSSIYVKPPNFIVINLFIIN